MGAYADIDLVALEGIHDGDGGGGDGWELELAMVDEVERCGGEVMEGGERLCNRE